MNSIDFPEINCVNVASFQSINDEESVEQPQAKRAKLNVSECAQHILNVGPEEVESIERVQAAPSRPAQIQLSTHSFLALMSPDIIKLVATFLHKKTIKSLGLITTQFYKIILLPHPSHIEPHVSISFIRSWVIKKNLSNHSEKHPIGNKLLSVMWSCHKKFSEYYNKKHLFDHVRHVMLDIDFGGDVFLKKLTNVQSLKMCSFSFTNKVDIHEFKHLILLRSLDINIIQRGELKEINHSFFPLLERLALNDGVSNEELHHLAKLNRLKELKLRKCEQLSHAGLGDLGALTQLRSLKLKNDRESRLEDNSFKQLSALKDLQSIKLVGFNSLAGEVFADCTLNALRHVSFVKCRNLRDVALQQIGQQTIMLQKVEIEECEHITDVGIQALSSLVNLKELHLRKCPRLTDEAFDQLNSLVNLQVVHLSYCKISKGIFSLFLARVRELTLTHITVSDTMIKKIVEKAPLLNKLEIDMAYRLVGKSLSVLGNLPDLRHLSIKKCSSITEEVFKGIARIYSLYVLRVEECRYFSDQNVATLASLPSLRRLEVLKCENVTAGSMQQIRKDKITLEISSDSYFPPVYQRIATAYPQLFPTYSSYSYFETWGM